MSKLIGHWSILILVATVYGLRADGSRVCLENVKFAVATIKDSFHCTGSSNFRASIRLFGCRLIMGMDNGACFLAIHSTAISIRRYN